MYEIRTTNDKLLYVSLLASLFVHAGLILSTSFTARNIPTVKKTAGTIELTYQVIKDEPKKEPQKSLKEVQMVRAKDLPAAPPVAVKVPPPKYDIFSDMHNDLYESSRSAPRLEVSQKQAPSIKALSGERKITVPLLQSEKIMSPKYLGYKGSIRQKIEKRAYQYAENSEFTSGEVYLTFVLTSSGALGEVKIIPEKTTASPRLQEIGLRSIKESAPFPPFPPDLQFPELPFSVIISFKGE